MDKLSVLCALIYSNKNSHQLFCENSNLNLTNFKQMVIFRANFWKFYPSLNFFYTSVICAVCDKFHVCTTYKENTTHWYFFRKFVVKTKTWPGLLIRVSGGKPLLLMWKDVTNINMLSTIGILFQQNWIPTRNWIWFTDLMISQKNQWHFPKSGFSDQFVDESHFCPQK